jgi:hypothetical protein
MAGGRPFKPGQSGNPDGRARGVERIVRETIANMRENVGKIDERDGWETLTRLLYRIATQDGYEAKDKIAATKLLFERGWGTPKAEIEVTATVTSEQLALIEAVRMTPHERRQLLGESSGDDDVH